MLDSNILIKSLGNGVLSFKSTGTLHTNINDAIINSGFTFIDSVELNETIYTMMEEGHPVSLQEARNIDEEELLSLIEAVKNIGNAAFLGRLLKLKNDIDLILKHE